ncbi:MAG: helix-turn-helix transcriptional regulator [Phycisphaerales bacterium]|nr:MAG: helix-turn-helix transcriptional regulator [Phycisphaerales bacterium]
MAAKRADRPGPCPPLLENRPLISSHEALEMMALFKVLANDTRLRLLHAVYRAGEPCVGDLAETVGMKPQAVSNQLQRMADRGILAFKRNGNQIHYRIADPCVVKLLDRGLCLMEEVRGGRG